MPGRRASHTHLPWLALGGWIIGFGVISLGGGLTCCLLGLTLLLACRSRFPARLGQSSALLFFCLTCLSAWLALAHILSIFSVVLIGVGLDIFCLGCQLSSCG